MQIRSDTEAAGEIAVYKAAMEAAVRLADLRQQRGLTQQQLADALEVSQRRVSGIERQSDLYLSTLKDYVEMLGSPSRPAG